MGLFLNEPVTVGYPRLGVVSLSRGGASVGDEAGSYTCPPPHRGCARYVSRRLMIDRTTISAIAAELGVSRHTVNTIAMQSVGKLTTAAGPDRLAGDGSSASMNTVGRLDASGARGPWRTGGYAANSRAPLADFVLTPGDTCG